MIIHTTHTPVVFSPLVAAEPDLSRLVVSNITSDRFSLSWQTGEKAFHNFIVEVRESAAPSRAMGRALPGEARATVMTGLKAATQYDIKLYASSSGQNSQPLFAVATTGIHRMRFTSCTSRTHDGCNQGGVRAHSVLEGGGAGVLPEEHRVGVLSTHAEQCQTEGPYITYFRLYLYA